MTVEIKPGRHHYRFGVDGKRWVVAPDAGSIVADGFGGKNALIAI